MTPFPIRLTTGLVALAACIALTSCNSTKKAGSDEGGIVDYTGPTSRMSESEKANYAFDESGNYREDLVAKQEGVTGVRDTPISSAYTQDPYEVSPKPSVTSNSSTPRMVNSGSSGARKSTGSSSRSTASSSRPKPKPRPKPVAKPTYVKVKPGDTLYGLSKSSGVSIAAIKAANGLKSDLIVDGKSLKIPKKN